VAVNRFKAGSAVAYVRTASPFGAYQHDAAGNRTWEDYGSSTNAVKHTWDSLNRMTALQGVSAGASYRYRADGMRVSKREGVTLGVNITEETVSGYYDVYATDRPTTRCYHDGQSGYEEDYTRKVSGVDTVDVVRYELGPRGIESQRVYSGAAGSALAQTALGFPVYDTHGNNAGMVALSGTVGHERTYSPWGEVVSSNGSPPQQGYCANLGHRSDPESALTYMRARYYEPTTGRFLSEDPARDGTNWYAYCNNDPVGRHDASGNSWQETLHLAGLSGYVALALTRLYFLSKQGHEAMVMSTRGLVFLGLWFYEDKFRSDALMTLGAAFLMFTTHMTSEEALCSSLHKELPSASVWTRANALFESYAQLVGLFLVLELGFDAN